MSADDHGAVAREAGFCFGLYFRAGNRLRFWGWNKPSKPVAEQQGVTVAEWLRFARSTMFSHPPAPHCQPVNRPEEEQAQQGETGSARGEIADRIRLICNGKGMGLRIS